MRGTPFPPQSAGRVMTEKVPTANADDTSAEAISDLRKHASALDTLSYVYILGKSGKLRGVVAIKTLMKARDHQKLKELMTLDPLSVHPYTDQEKAAILAIRHNIKAVPVVNKDGVFMGIIPTDRILEILHAEHIEDILKLSGLDIKLLTQMESSDVSGIGFRGRLPWLVLGLLGGLLTTWIVSHFEATLTTLLPLAFFMPIIVYMSGAIASQTLSLVIRNLLITGTDLWQYFSRELITGTILGITFGSIISALAFFWLNSAPIALIILVSMTANSALATTIATTVPWVLQKLNRDPALAAGPFAIVMQDMVSLLVYFTTASTILRLT